MPDTDYGPGSGAAMARATAAQIQKNYRDRPGKPMQIAPYVASPKAGGINSISAAGGSSSNPSPADAAIEGKGQLY